MVLDLAKVSRQILLELKVRLSLSILKPPDFPWRNDCTNSLLPALLFSFPSLFAINQSIPIFGLICRLINKIVNVIDIFSELFLVFEVLQVAEFGLSELVFVSLGLGLDVKSVNCGVYCQVLIWID